MSQQKRHHRTFSEDERIQAQESVKKVEDDDAGEISEPEDPLMLQRDAKDWKVICNYIPHQCPLFYLRYQIHPHPFYRNRMAKKYPSRAKTTMLSSGSPATDTALQSHKSRPPTAKKSSAITPTNGQQPALPKMTPFSNAYKKRPKSYSTRSSGGNSIPLTKVPTSTLPRKKRHRRKVG